MTFKQILQDTDCDCLANSEEKTETIFARKINKPQATDNDFKSHWERGKRADECDKICGFKGVSINEWNENTEKDVIQKFLTTFRITPKHKDSILIFNFLSDAGQVIYTPNEKDKSHHDFYKSDDFSLQFINAIQCISLKDLL